MQFICFLILFVTSALTALNRNQNFWFEDHVTKDGKPHLLVRRMALKGLKWSKGVVPYTFGPGLETLRGLIKQAAEEFATKTCIRFVPKKGRHEHYVQFIRDDSRCGEATVCRAGGVQNVWIGEKCMNYDTVIHELGHAICMSHEHQRPDRDEYVTFNCTRDSNEYGKWDHKDVSTFGLMYDYVSVMHYQLCNGKCMKPKLPGVTDCGGRKLSVLDAEKINSLYKCGGCHGYRFRPHYWSWSYYAAGIDTDGAQLGVCRAYVQGDIAIGKQRGQGTACSIPYGGSEHVFSKSFEVLTEVSKKRFRWLNMRKGQVVPYGAIPGGRDKRGEPLYIGRCNATHDDKNAIFPGKIENGDMYYTHGGKEHECDTFQLLYCLGK